MKPATIAHLHKKDRFMNHLSNDRAIAIQTFHLIPTPQGQVTLSLEIRDRLQPNPDNPLALLTIDDLIVLTSKQPQVTQLSEQFTTQMAKHQISLEALLDGLQEERQILWQELQQCD